MNKQDKLTDILLKVSELEIPVDKAEKQILRLFNVSSRFICDCCGDEWEIAFKCEKCSNRLEPILDEDGFEDVCEKFDICGNCCDCHLRSK